MIKNIIFAFFVCCSGSKAQEPRRSPAIDARLRSEDWIMKLVSKNEPKDQLGYSYKLYEGVNEIILIYQRDGKNIKTVSLKGDEISVVPCSKVSLNDEKVRIDSKEFNYIGGGKFGNRIY